MPHYPGHQDDRTPRGGGMPVIPAQPNPVIPPVSGAAVWSATQPRNMATATMFDKLANTRNKALDYLKTLQYDVTPYGASPRQSFVQDGMTYRWNPRSKMYEVVGWSGTGAAAATGGDTTSPGGPGGPGKENPYAKINRKANQQRLAARTAYMNKLGSAEEQARLARVGAVEAPAALASNLAQRAIGGFGGISEAAKQYVGDVFRTQEGQQIAAKAGAYADYLTSRLGIAREEAEAIALKAIEQADANAAKVMGEMRRRLESIGQTVSSAVDMSKKAGERELAYVESLLGGK